MTPLFENFVSRRIKTTGAEINLVVGGSGPPLLLLHGYPQTHAMWHKIAPRLAQRLTGRIPAFHLVLAGCRMPTIGCGPHGWAL